MFSEKVIQYFTGLNYTGNLPPGISIMNPFRENPEIMPLISEFYQKYYSDENYRYLILGINPGRFGAGVTGIPFTDTKRLRENCGISIPEIETFETSSVFMYEMIEAFGGVKKFYSKFFISSVSPLGFTSPGKHGSAVNYNYYDSKMLTGMLMDFIIENIIKQLDFGIKRDICFCLGTGKNYKFISESE